jgi:drug/metabolite transporter (DMT)-like permease
MYSSISNNALDHLVERIIGKHPTSDDWSSLIGVVTAICGNILISFALNTQRYAHIRLSRARDAQRKAAKRLSRQSRSNSSDRLDETLQIGNKSPKDIATPNAATHQQGELGERQPLLPRVDSRRASRSSDGSLRDEDEKEDDEEKEKSYLKSPIWWLGISLMIVGEAGNFLAYGFAPASIVSPLGVVALISNCLIAPLLLGEVFRWRDGLGVLIAIAGCVVVVLSASESNPKLSPDAIWHLVSRWEFETYVGVTVFMIVVLAFCSNKYGDRTLLIDLGLVGLFGAYTALSTKGVASLLALDIWRVVTYPITYLLVAVLVFTAVMQIKYVNRALQHFNATMVIPTQFVLFTISVIVGSAVLYRDFETKKTDDAIKFVAGCALTFSGVWCITSGRSNESEDDDDDEEDEEESIDLAVEQTAYGKLPIDDGALMGDEPTRGLQRSHTSGEVPITISATQLTSSETSEAESSIHNLTNPFVDIAPANATAVHMDSVARLTTPTNDGDPTRKPPFHATTSAPVVPTTPTHNRGPVLPRHTLTRTPSTPNRTAPGQPQDPTRLTSNPSVLDPASSPHRLLTRQSVAGLLPGPLTSPLSSSLAAIVADELRRSTNQTLRRKRSHAAGAGAAAPFFSARPKRHSIASGTEADFEREALLAGAPVGSGAAGSQPGGRKPGRMRSLSATLGDIFGSVGRKKGSAMVAPPGAEGEGRGAET